MTIFQACVYTNTWGQYIIKNKVFSGACLCKSLHHYARMLWVVARALLFSCYGVVDGCLLVSGIFWSLDVAQAPSSM